MALKKTDNRDIGINATIDWLLNFRDSLFFGQWYFSYKYCLDELYNERKILTNNLEELIKIWYGEAEDKEDDLEYKLAKILTLYRLLFACRKSPHNFFEFKNFLKEVRDNIQKYVPEYIVTFDENGDYKGYKPAECVSIAENLNDIPEDIADPIKEILQPMKTENELIGLISKIYSKFEKIKGDNLINLNDVDKGIYKKAWNLAKMVANNVDAAKGHEGNSSLTVKDIAHNFALNASLLQKLIAINNGKD